MFALLKKRSILLFVVFATQLAVAELAVAEGNPRVKIETSMGNMVLELDPKNAPKTVANFLKYVDGAFYDGTIFHRVVKGFVVQGGGYTPQGEEKKTGEPVRNESYNGLRNDVGTIAMARTEDPHSARVQFYINTGNNESLNGSEQKFGYTVFGKVVEGMDVVKAIENTEVSPDLFLGRHRPVKEVLIKKARTIRALNSLLEGMK
ncbi:MAG: peptidylprolyl isomerase [Gammaproteobacteria bacterium CG22_combo_CG10-13_8_21_14_all_40_8]|nr:MAG: peptidylprolyl isomerase [Gammaproteobacteria bacterium CG22_combo_CG10-13_8_21_14_all_40_8]